MVLDLNKILNDVSDRMGGEFIISVEGNIGAGKSTFIKELSKIISSEILEIIDEPVEEWQNINGFNILQEFYRDPEKYAYAFQTLVFAFRVIYQQKPLAKKVRITERSIYTDYLFAKILRSEGKINEKEWAIYDSWYTKALSMLLTNKPNLIIYLDTESTKCEERKIERNRSGEDAIEIEYLQKLQAHHDEWMPEPNFGITADNIVYVRLDGNKHNNQADMFDDLSRFIENYFITFNKTLT